jgi:mannose-6-phosphate isomerase-like protein (cupin superfamily)
MRSTVIAMIGVLGLCGTVALAKGSGRGQGGATIPEQAPANHSIAIPKETLDQYLKDMDAKGLSTLRMIEGGKFSVNIRRITGAETALVHPITIDVWVVIAGSGRLTTGGKIENGKIVGGTSHPLKVGDVEFIPAGLPHGVSGVNGNITWLNVRWDADWAADAELGAGTRPGRGGRGAAAAGRGAAAAGGGGQRGARGGEGDGGSAAPLEYAPTDHAIDIPKEKLDAYRKDMDAKNMGTLRMIEGGHFNVNIRRIKTPSVELHPITIDTWVVLEGSGTANTAFRNEGGKMVQGTGVSAPVRVGDVFFVPANLTHGLSEVDGAFSWLNIRWDVDWPKK